MRRGYGQYCPLALAAELLCERWTLLIISRLVDGCSQFNEIHRGVPRLRLRQPGDEIDDRAHGAILRLSRLRASNAALTSAATSGVTGWSWRLQTERASAGDTGLLDVDAELA